MNQLDHSGSSPPWSPTPATSGNWRSFAPRDATTNPSLILKAVQQPEYAPLLADTVAAHGGQPLDEIVDQVLVRFGREILKVVPGRVSTEVDARLSFDSACDAGPCAPADRPVRDGRRAAQTRADQIAATWEGIQAARVLETEASTATDAAVRLLPGRWPVAMPASR